MLACLRVRRFPPPPLFQGACIRHLGTSHSSDFQLEETSLHRYSQKRYYPVRIGQCLANRYKVISKLGFGAYSTVWLARDQSTERYATVKVSVHDDSSASPVLNEVNSVRHLKECGPDHAGFPIARLPHDHFELDGPMGRHHCLVSDPQGCNLWTLRHLFPESRLPPELVNPAVRCLLKCVNWLHVHGDMIHTDITTTNVLTQKATDELFAAMELDEQLNPSAHILVDGYPVYQSRGQPRNVLDLTGMAYLTDFGSARSRQNLSADWCMSDMYRAPEVLMGVRWGCQVDVWSIGILALELVQGTTLFNAIDYTRKQYVLPLALAQYISVLGPPPPWMVEESESPDVRSFFDAQGQWIGGVPIPHFSLESWLTALPPGDEKDKFIRFMRRILVWDSMERATSYDLLYDEWQDSS